MAPNCMNHCQSVIPSARLDLTPETCIAPHITAIVMQVLGALTLAIVIWAVYGRTVHAPFICDDLATVVKNPSIAKLWPLLDSSGHSSPLNPPEGIPTSGRPLLNLSLAINYYFGGLDPFGYHVVNIVMHLLSTLLLWAILHRTLRLEYFCGRFEHVAGALSFAVALVWAVHPLQTETIVYVTQRSEAMASLFYLATLYGGLRYWAATSATTRSVWLILTTLACAVWHAYQRNDGLGTGNVAVIRTHFSRRIVPPILSDLLATLYWSNARMGTAFGT